MERTRHEVKGCVCINVHSHYLFKKKTLNILGPKSGNKTHKIFPENEMKWEKIGFVGSSNLVFSILLAKQT